VGVRSSLINVDRWFENQCMPPHASGNPPGPAVAAEATAWAVAAEAGHRPLLLRQRLRPLLLLLAWAPPHVAPCSRPYLRNMSSALLRLRCSVVRLLAFSSSRASLLGASSLHTEKRCLGWLI
jgi:hypothetical protein